MLLYRVGDFYETYSDDAVTLREKKISDLNAINNFIFNLEDSSDVVESFKTDHIIIETEDQMEWAIDGEKGGPHKVTEITAVNKAIRVIS